MPLKAPSETCHADSANPLAKLPAELILDIFELLPPVDALSFRTASKYIYNLSLNKSVQDTFRELQGDEVHEYAWRRRKDCFNRLAEYEMANDESKRYTPRGKLLCAYCLDFHPSSAFGPLQREGAAIIPSERLCTASKATVYFCPHKQMAFRAFLRLFKASRTPDLCSWTACAQTCNPWITADPMLSTFNLHQAIPLYMADLSGPWGTQEYPALTRCRRCSVACFPGSVASADILEAIKDMDVYICPHTQGKEKEKVAHLLEKIAAEARGCYYGGEHTVNDPNVKLITGGETEWHCEESGCGAALYVVLDGIKSRVNTYRYLNMTTVTSENWLANTESPGLWRLRSRLE